MSAAAVLRARTSAAHADVDDVFGAYDLGERAGYCAFLTAHARALPVVERLIARDAALPATRARMPLLVDDLAALGQAVPKPLVFDGTRGAAAGWGILYVVEGSRLGGGVFARRVATGLPGSYLNARHASGAWRALVGALDAEAARHDSEWLDDLTTAALACFDLYRRAGTERV